MSTLCLSCDHCGAPLPVEAGKEYYVCRSCKSRLILDRNESVYFTKSLQQIDESTRRAAERIALLQLFYKLIREDLRYCAESFKLTEDGLTPWELHSGPAYWVWNYSRGIPQILTGLIMVVLNLSVEWPTVEMIANYERLPGMPFGLVQIACLLVSGFVVVHGAKRFSDELARPARIRVYDRYHDSVTRRLLLEYKLDRADREEEIGRSTGRTDSHSDSLVKRPCTQCGAALEIPAETSYVTCRGCRSNLCVRASSAAGQDATRGARQYRRLDRGLDEIEESAVWDLYDEREARLQTAGVLRFLAKKDVSLARAIVPFVVWTSLAIVSCLFLETQAGRILATVATYMFFRGLFDPMRAVILSWGSTRRHDLRDDPSWRADRVDSERRLKAGVLSLLSREEADFLEDAQVPQLMQEEDPRILRTLLDTIDSKLGPRPREITEAPNGESFRIRRVVKWYRRDGMRRYYKQVGDAIVEGALVWGVVAKSDLLSVSGNSSNTIGVVLYPVGGGEYVPPEKLEPIARKLLAEQHRGRSRDPRIQHLADVLGDENERFFDYQLPPAFCNGYSLAASYIVFERNHLPNGRLSRKVVPLLVKPTEPRVPMVVPSGFWPQAFIDYWIMGTELTTLAKEKE